MRRRYTAEQFREAIALIRERVPDVAITTDVIAGFPGETPADSEATCELCEAIGFAAVHCFPYSRRPHTGADRMTGHLPPPAKRARLERLLDIAGRSSESFRRSYTGRTLPVLWERRSNDLWEGLTPNYIRAYSDADAPLENRILPAHLVRPHGEGMLADIEASDAR